MKKFITIFCLFSFIFTLVANSQTELKLNNVTWQKIGPGIEFYESDFGKWFKKGKIYAIKIDKTRKLKVLTGLNHSPVTLKYFEKKFNSVITVNGGYFQENFKPSGLVKVNNKILYNLNKTGGSGIFAINNNETIIFHKNNFKKYNFFYHDMIQNGPILVENNGKMGIYSDDHEYTARTIIGITKDKKTIIVIADMNASPSLWEMANILSKNELEGGFNCETSLNLDGGSSTGLRIKLPVKKLVVEESSYISNGIGVF